MVGKYHKKKFTRAFNTLLEETKDAYRKFTFKFDDEDKTSSPQSI
jgi:hypothetical protein